MNLDIDSHSLHDYPNRQDAKIKLNYYYIIIITTNQSISRRQNILLYSYESEVAACQLRLDYHIMVIIVRIQGYTKLLECYTGNH